MTQTASSAGPVRPGTPSAQPDAAARAFGITPEDYMLPTRTRSRWSTRRGVSGPSPNRAPSRDTSTACPSDAELLAAYEQLVDRPPGQ